MKKNKPKRRIPLPRKTGGIHKPKKGKGSYKRILKDFSEKLIKNQEDLPSKFSKIVDENFWELQ